MKLWKEALMWVVIFVGLFLLATSFSQGKPVLPAPPKKQDQYQYPNLNYESNWGKMSIDRNTGEIIIREHPHWEAEAQFVTPTKIYIVWYWKLTGKPGPGIYDLKDDGTLVGWWNWDAEIYIDPKTWEATGNPLYDKIFPVK